MLDTLKTFDNQPFSALQQFLQHQDFSQLTSRELRGIVRALKKVTDKPTALRIGLLGNTTLNTLPEHIAPHLVPLGLTADFFVGDINQHFQAVLDPQHALHAFNPELLCLALNLKELAPGLINDFGELALDARESLFEETLTQIQQWVFAALKNTSAHLILCTFPTPAFYNNGLADHRDPLSQADYHHRLNQGIRSLVKEHSRCHLLDIQHLVANLGLQQAYDAKLWYMAKIDWSESLQRLVGAEFTKLVLAQRGLAKKCLVLDLDNTLWGGIIGEDGPLGVKVGSGHPTSEAFYDFQLSIRALKARGILLAICSKNNLDDVKETFEKRSEMPLKLADFSVVMANWEHKPHNIQRIATQLNIGLDSLVFVDDNPVEVNMVRETLPMVISLQLPAEPERLSTFLLQQPWFEKTQLLADDKNKTEQYRQNSAREALKESSEGLEGYLTSLQTEAVLRLATPEDTARVHQLFTKTNQFNVTTKRYALDEVERFIASPEFDLYVFSVSDKFGDLGIVGQVLVTHHDDCNEIDSFIMSCRAMGRSIEKKILHAIMQHYLSNQKSLNQEQANQKPLTKEAMPLTAEFRPTAKNIPCATFFDDAGFQLLSDADGVKRYEQVPNQNHQDTAHWIALTTDFN